MIGPHRNASAAPSVDEIMADVKEHRASWRAFFPDQPLFWDETLVAEIERLRAEILRLCVPK